MMKPLSRRIGPVFVLGLLFFAVDSFPAQETKAPKEDPSHEELRELRKHLTDAINRNDLDALLQYLDDDVVVTWQNAEVSRKPAGVRAYYERMMHGPNRIVESIHIDPTVDELTHLYGDTGIAFGSSHDHFKLTDGMDFEVDTRWSAAVVKKNGKWLIASFHASTNMFDNPILRIAIRKVAIWTALVAGVSGLLVGFLGGRVLKRKR
jgi:ketosteroid isomerase-like protein